MGYAKGILRDSARAEGDTGNSRNPMTAWTDFLEGFRIAYRGKRKRAHKNCLADLVPGAVGRNAVHVIEQHRNEVNMSRIENHPILGETPERKLVQFTYDGKTLEGYEGEPIASALRVAGVMAHRYTKKKHEPRGVFCAIGRCTDCVMVVNGKPNVRTCITPLEEGMVVETQYGVSNKKEDM